MRFPMPIPAAFIRCFSVSRLDAFGIQQLDRFWELNGRMQCPAVEMGVIGLQTCFAPSWPQAGDTSGAKVLCYALAAQQGFAVCVAKCSGEVQRL